LAGSAAAASPITGYQQKIKKDFEAIRIDFDLLKN